MDDPLYSDNDRPFDDFAYLTDKEQIQYINLVLLKNKLVQHFLTVFFFQYY